MADEDLQPIEPPEDHECPDDGADAVARGDVTAAARGWGPGWPEDNSRKMSVVRAGEIALSVRAELGPLVSWLVTECVNRGYALRHGECWGFANRPIRGTNRPSNHSWGLAVDLNARTNPMGPNLVTDMPPWLVELWTSKGYRWGGTYQGRKDAMHFEYMGTPGDAAGVIASLGAAAGPLTGPGPAASPSARPLLRQGAKGDDVRFLQERLNANGAQLTLDGDFGPRTTAAVRAFQQAHGLAVDAVVGPATWAALGA